MLSARFCQKCFALTLLCSGRKVLHQALGNNNIRVDSQTETVDGLVICLSDPSDFNFTINDGGKLSLWAIDFGCTCFLPPPSFVFYSLTSSSDVFAQHVAHRVNYRCSANFQAMRFASGGLAIFNDNALGK